MKVRQCDVHRHLKRWVKHLDMQSWQLRVRFVSLPKRMVAQVEVFPQYEFAIVRFDLYQIEKTLYNQQELEEVVVHELIHCVVPKASERAVTQMSRALLRAAGRW